MRVVNREVSGRWLVVCFLRDVEPAQRSVSGAESGALAAGLMDTSGATLSPGWHLSRSSS